MYSMLLFLMLTNEVNHWSYVISSAVVLTKVLKWPIQLHLISVIFKQPFDTLSDSKKQFTAKLKHVIISLEDNKAFLLHLRNWCLYSVL